MNAFCRSTSGVGAEVYGCFGEVRDLSFDRTMSSRRFKVAFRPRLSAITEHPKMDFVDYERRLTSLQGVRQLVQQAYLGTPSAQSSFSRVRIPPARAASFAASAGPSIRAASGSIRSLRRTNRARPAPPAAVLAALARAGTDRRFRSILVWARFGRTHQGFATETEWRRAYREINEFERVLVGSGIRLVKLFLHITPDEQRRRFRNRLIDPVKRWKLSYEDFRNRGHWREYEKRLRT